MRHIAQLDPSKVQEDGKYKFRDRAQALMNKWHHILYTPKQNGSNGIEQPAEAKVEAIPPPAYTETAEEVKAPEESAPTTTTAPAATGTTKESQPAQPATDVAMADA